MNISINCISHIYLKSFNPNHKYHFSLKMSLDRIFYKGLINSKNINSLTNKISCLNKNQTKHSKNPIWLIITSKGGNISEQYKAFHAIKKSKRPIYTIIDKHACSAGLIVGLAGSKRYITEGSFAMIHSVCTNKYFYKSLNNQKKGILEVHVSEQNNLGLLQNNKLINDINRVMIRIIKKETKSKLNNSLIHQMVKKDTFLKVTDCIHYGLVHNLININDFHKFHLNDYLISDT